MVGPLRVCPGAGCTRAVPLGSRCPEHPAPPRRPWRPTERSREHDRRRGDAASRGYDATWRRLRGAQLKREPLCRRCRDAGYTKPATEVDHIIPLRQGGARLDPENLQSLCRRCHAIKTMRESRPITEGERVIEALRGGG